MPSGDYTSDFTGPQIDTRVAQVATNTSDIAGLKSRMSSAELALETKADTSTVMNLSSQVSGIAVKIPSEASSSNKLADKAFVNSGLSSLSSSVSNIQSALANKVDKVSGKGLSTNDYTTTDKNKVASIGNLSDLETEDKSSIVAAINEAATTGSGGGTLSGYVVYNSISDLPSTGDPTLGYLVGTHLYLYVGTGGDTKDGKYQDCGEFKGPKGDDGVGFASVASQQDGTVVITLTNGDSITIDLNHNHPAYPTYVLCNTESDYTNLQVKESDTLYLIKESQSS